MEKALIWAGVALMVVGAMAVALGVLLGAVGGRGGRLLPGDIVISRPGFTFVFPIVTSLVVSALLTLVLWVVVALRR